MADRSAIEQAPATIVELLRRELWEAAESTCREALKVTPNNSQVWFYLSECTRRRGSLNEAIDALRRAITLDQNQVVYWNNVSLLLQEQGQFVEAESTARRAVA